MWRDAGGRPGRPAWMPSTSSSTDCAVITSIDHRPHGVSRPRPRKSIGYEKAGIMRTGQAGGGERPGAPPAACIEAAHGEIDADLWLSWGWTFTFLGRSSQQWAWAWPRPPLRRPGLPGIAGREPASSMPAGVLAAFVGPAREPAGHAPRPVRSGLSTGGTAGPFPDRRRASRPWCWMWPTTRIRWPPWRHNLDADGLFSRRTHAVFGAMARQGSFRSCLERMSTRSSTAGISPICRCNALRRPTTGRRPAQAQCARRSTRRKDTVTAQTPFRTRSGPHCRAAVEPRQTPLIESWSSDRSTPWVAC